MLAALFSGRDGAVQVDEASCVTCREGRDEGREQKTSFLRKESNECMACPVSVKQRFNIAAFSSKPPPGRS